MQKFRALAFFLLFYTSVGYAELISHDINDYINRNWKELYRSISDCEAYNDSKVKGSKILYLPYNFSITPEIHLIQKKCHLKIKHLPRVIKQIGDVKTTEINPHGLLYLPKGYIVPGGRFNEMYGWDSYFIILGLIKSGETVLAENMLENYYFEINHYGAILNANRTYHLSRSQPPFFTAAILAVYNAKPQKNKAWLLRFYNAAVKEHNQWIRPPFLAGKTNLSRYYDNENQPLIEAKAYPHFYDKVFNYFKEHPVESKRLFDGKNLSAEFFQGERSLRASGFDITARFGPFGGRTHQYAPVCLNSLLYKTEMDLSYIAKLLNRSQDEKQWKKKAAKTKHSINHYLYNKKLGMFVDYNFVTHQQSTYSYLTTFYPLWVNLATKKQAAKLIQKIPLFETQHGLAMSENETGLQWDKPFAWAPLHLLIVQGLYNYGYALDGKRLANKFNRMVKNNFDKSGHIYEKYNVVTGESKTQFLGYEGNVIGFGWTNATYLLFEDLLLTERNSRTNV